VGVIIGMDPHKRSATIEVVDDRGVVLSKARFGTDRLGYRDMLAQSSVRGPGVGD
jgi:transposase